MISASAQIEHVGLPVLRWLSLHSRQLVAAQGKSQGLRHVSRDLGFHRENIFHPAIVTLRPEMPIAGEADELDVDPYSIARFLHASLQEVGNAQRARDLGQILR